MNSLKVKIINISLNITDNKGKDNNSSPLNKDIIDINGEHFTNKDDTLGRLLRDEDQASGRVTWKIYDRFFRIQGGYSLFIIIIILAILVGVANTIGKLYVTDWTDRAEKKDGDKIKKEDNYKFFIKYSLILFSSVAIQ